MIQDTPVNTPSHTPGISKGESLSKPTVQRPTRKADDATGINIADRKPISSKMPILPPA